MNPKDIKPQPQAYRGRYNAVHGFRISSLSIPRAAHRFSNMADASWNVSWRHVQAWPKPELMDRMACQIQGLGFGMNQSLGCLRCRLSGILWHKPPNPTPGGAPLVFLQEGVCYVGTGCVMYPGHEPIYEPPLPQVFLRVAHIVYSMHVRRLCVRVV